MDLADRGTLLPPSPGLIQQKNALQCLKELFPQKVPSFHKNFHHK